MSAVLEFPPIADTEPTRTDVAVAAGAAIDLAKIDLTDVALAQFGDWRGTVAEAETRLKNVAWDLTTTKGFADIKTQRNTVAKQPRADANKIADALVSKLTAVSKEVRAEQKRIVEAWDGLAAPLTVLIDARQAELDEAARLAEIARAAAAAIEAARKAKHEERIATIRAYLHRCQDDASMTSLRVATGIAALSALTFGPECEEYAVQAANAQCETLEAMRVLQARLLGREQEAERQELIRLENERQAEANRLERKRIDEEAAAIRKQAAELAAAQEVARLERAETERLQRIAEDARVAASQKAPMAAEIWTDLLPAEPWTDPDPDAATKLPTDPPPEKADDYDAPCAAELAPPATCPLVSEAWVREWFARHYACEPNEVFDDGAEALTLEAALKFAQAAKDAHIEYLLSLARRALPMLKDRADYANSAPVWHCTGYEANTLNALIPEIEAALGPN